VGLGLLAELRLSGADELREQVRQMMAAQGLPTRLQDVDLEAIIFATARDKKRVGGGPRAVRPLPGAGVARCSDRRWRPGTCAGRSTS